MQAVSEEAHDYAWTAMRSHYETSLKPLLPLVLDLPHRSA